MSFELLTGATGFLGSYLLRDALVAGRNVAVMVRGHRNVTAHERVEEMLERFRRETDEQVATPTVIEADLHEPDLGLDRSSRSWIAERCHRLVHCAASLSFQAQAGEPYRTNVDGTRYVLELCRESGIRDLRLISTAYVCGRRRGLVMEAELECGQEFSNDYERSKYISELLVRHSPFLDRWDVYRPSVIVGDTKTGFASSSDGLYAFLRMVSLSAGRPLDEILDKLGLAVDDGLNLVPVDWVSATIGHLLDRQAEGPSMTYHLTNPTPVTPSELFAAASSRGLDGPPVPLEALDEVLEVYRPYLEKHAEFDCSNTTHDAPHSPCPRLDGPTLERLIGFSFESHREPAPVLAGSDHRALVLSVAGPGGGDFDLSQSAAAERIPSDEIGDASARAYCNSIILDRLLSREMTVEQAIYGGVLSLEAEPTELARATELLGSYLAENRTRLSLVATRGIA